MQFDGLFLDMYGTLTTGDRAAVESTCQEIIRHTGLPLTPRRLSVIWGERFFAAMNEANGDAFERLCDLEARTLCETMAALRVCVDPAPYVGRLVAYWRDPPLQPEAREFLNGLATPVCLVTNADRVDVETALERLGVHVAALITSEDSRSYKPHPKIFEDALAATGWQRERVLHVGDSLHSDVGGARGAGIHTGWVNRAHRIHDIGNHAPDHEFADLLAVRAFIGAC